MAKLEDVKSIWRNADAVTFDVDSTVIQEEGIDELAKFCGKGDEVAALTSQAMQGNVTFRQSLTKRLNIIKPSYMQVKQFLLSHPPKLTPGTIALVTALQAHKKQVFLVSGGFHCLIAPVATLLNIPIENVFANKLKFYFTGEYAGFDENQPTAASGGKAKVIEHLKKEIGLKTIVHVGDGVTDLETISIADSFIGYGGNIVRESVKLRAPWFITNFNELTNAL
ncbi:phosphoserine phosphatase [Colletes gigas]|uniref:phosphoserine phosphatase n=1 Tax=Colletes gigas TaxID=935657 RepID=UPI001C9A5504|nr:phosphoserine phosphatase [Colletes gigas]XP_043248085.1 phosphoserine phosphatase [Colletes gigas]XP_043248086.1 phosphoserine phosphatase [Colletes gigas]XP_043248088.1 phosphoserine phosphatase [Colletes gigas]